jgi:hypothetical protein
MRMEYVKRQGERRRMDYGPNVWEELGVEQTSNKEVHLGPWPINLDFLKVFAHFL